VGRKVAEMIGSEEKDFVEFILGLLAKHEGPPKVGCCAHALDAAMVFTPDY
jgi:hypothetical protein